MDTLSQSWIYQNILPLDTATVDLAKLDQHGSALAYTWVEQLLQQGHFKLSAQPDFSTAAKVRHLYTTSRNQDRVKGYHELGFGYPIVLWQQQGKPMAAPLFIWQLELTPTPDTADAWLFAHNANNFVSYNQALLEHFLQQDVPIESLLTRTIQQGTIRARALVDCCLELAELAGLDNTAQQLAVMEAPTSDEALTALQNRGTILWSGVVGMFPPQPLNPYATPDISERTLPEPTGHEFGLLDTDPAQASAFKVIHNNNCTFVQGASGSGKTHLLLHLLSNALSNGKRCLVVAESFGALQQIQERLAQLELATYSFLLRNGFTDKTILLDLLRAVATAETAETDHDEAEFRAALDKCKRLKAKLDAQYHTVKQQLLGPYTWTQVVGMFLRSNRTEGRELLSGQLNTQDFDFQYDEYLQLQQDIRTAFPLYQKVNTLRHPLSNLHQHLFIKNNKSQALHNIQKLLAAFLDKASALQHRYITKTTLYADLLNEYYESRYSELSVQLQRLQDRLADHSSRYGADFDLAGTGILKLRGVFSNKTKTILEAREEVTEAFQNLQKTFLQHHPFEFNFLQIGESKNIQKIRRNLEDFSQALQRWRESLPALVQDDVQRLNAKTANDALYLQDQIGELEYDLDLLTEELNEAQLYEQPFENKTLTIPRRQKYLEDIIEQLEITQLYLRDFDHFYDWQRLWLSLSASATKVIRGLIKVKPTDWHCAFESWYLHNCLATAPYAEFHSDSEHLTDYVGYIQQLRQLLPNQIRQHWQKEREEALRKLRRNHRETYDALWGKRNQELSRNLSLPELLHNGLDALSATYPILLATPLAINRDLPKAIQHFDYVLIEDIQHFPVAQAAKALHMGQRLVLFGDPDQAMPGAGTLLDWATETQLPVAPLPFCHRWNPGNLRQIINSMTLEEAAVGNCKFRFEQIDGRYDEADGSNDEEAQEIIRLLNDIKPTAQRTYPSVGIACFTVGQRNLITSYLLKIKQVWSPGAEKIQQLERNGLGVFHLPELRGQHFDVLIISTAYGIIDSKATLTSHVQQLYDHSMTGLLYLLMGTPRREVLLVNSIPESQWQSWLHQVENPGVFLLSNYLAYIKAFANSDAQAQQAIAQRLQHWAHPNGIRTPDNLFAEEAANALQPYFESGRLKTQVQEAHFQLPLLLLNARQQQPVISIQPDVFFAETPETDFVWEHQQRNLMMNYGFRYLPLWSVNWWKNPNQEARKLASLIIKMEAENAPTEADT